MLAFTQMSIFLNFCVYPMCIFTLSRAIRSYYHPLIVRDANKGAINPLLLQGAVRPPTHENATDTAAEEIILH